MIWRTSEIRLGADQCTLLSDSCQLTTAPSAAKKNLNSSILESLRLKLALPLYIASKLMVDLQHNSLQHSLGSRNSSSSAVDLTGTPLVSVIPCRRLIHSTLQTLQTGVLSVLVEDASQDPLRLNLDPLQSNRRIPPALQPDDPFFSPEETNP